MGSAIGREVRSEIRFGRAVGEVPYEETDSHYASVKRRILSQACGKRRIRREHPALERIRERDAARDVLQKRDDAGAADFLE